MTKFLSGWTTAQLLAAALAIACISPIGAGGGSSLLT